MNDAYTQFAAHSRTLGPKLEGRSLHARTPLLLFPFFAILRPIRSRSVRSFVRSVHPPTHQTHYDKFSLRHWNFLIMVYLLKLRMCFLLFSYNRQDPRTESFVERIDHQISITIRDFPVFFRLFY